MALIVKRAKVADHNYLFRSVTQTFEWIYGNTNIEYKIHDINLYTDSLESKYYSYRITTNIVRFTGYKHPTSLLYNEMTLSLTGVCEDTDEYLTGSDRVSLKKPIGIEIVDLPHFILQEDQSGFSVINVQHVLGLISGGEKSVSRHFTFRNNLLNSLR